MNDFLQNLKNSIKKGKTGKAKTLLAGFRNRRQAEKEEILQMIALSSDKTALELLSFLTDKEQKDLEMHERLIQLVVDRAHLNYRFVLVLFENADRPTIVHAMPLLKHTLNNETDKNLLSAVIRAIGKMKIEGMISDLAEFIFYDDLKLKSDSVNALERIGTPQALEKLELAAKTEKCDQDILDAIQVLKTAHEEAPAAPQPVPEKKDPDQLVDLGNLTSESVEKRFEALVGFSEKKLNLSEALAKDHVYEDYDLMINLLRLVSRMIPLDAVPALFNIIGMKKIDPNIKFLAYDALAAYPELESAASVLQGLSESAMYVRLAAIKALDKNLTDFVCADVKNKIESGTKKGEMLAQAILDANARNLIKCLMASDTFSYMASNYLSKSAPIYSLNTFIDILQSRNLKSTARKYIDMRKARLVNEQDPFVVVSSSDAILNVYSKLIFSCGFPCQTFRRPQEAFEAIVFKKPSAFICDLFLTDLTGMDLAREVRDLYAKNEVPVILSTLQKNLNPDQLKKEKNDAQVNALCDFPAKTSQIRAWVK